MIKLYDIIGLGEMAVGGISAVAGIYSSLTGNSTNILWVSTSMAVFIDGFVRQADQYGSIERIFKSQDETKINAKNL